MNVRLLIIHRRLILSEYEDKILQFEFSTQPHPTRRYLVQLLPGHAYDYESWRSKVSHLVSLL